MTTLPAEITKSYTELTNVKIVVNSPETEVAVRKHWGTCTTWLKVNKKLVDALKEPFKKAIKEIDAVFNPMKEKIEQIESESFRALNAWNNRQTVKIENSNQKKIEKFENKAASAEAEAVAAGKPIPVTPLPNLQAAPAKTVVVDGAAQSWINRKDWWLTGRTIPYDRDGLYVGDPVKEFKTYTMKQNAEEPRGEGSQMIPMDLFILDTAKVGSIIRAGGSIPGITPVFYKTLSQREAK